MSLGPFSILTLLYSLCVSVQERNVVLAKFLKKCMTCLFEMKIKMNQNSFIISTLFSNQTLNIQESIQIGILHTLVNVQREYIDMQNKSYIQFFTCSVLFAIKCLIIYES